MTVATALRPLHASGRFLLPNGTPLHFGIEETRASIPERLARVAAWQPDQVAVRDRTGSLTFSELKRRADRIAAALLDRTGPGSHAVALLLPTGIDAVAAIYGILTAGKFYVPIDPPAPEAHQRHVLADCEARLLLTSEALRDRARRIGGDLPILTVEDPPACQERLPRRAPIAPDDLAYVLYTSGSTGEPKGVMQTHATVLTDMQRQGRDLGTTPGDRYGLLFAPSSSASACHLFGGLLNGASVSIYDLKSQGISGLAEWFASEAITVCDIGVSTWRLFAASLQGHERFPALRMIAPGGEPVYSTDVEIFRRICEPGCVLQSSLGTTETRTVTQCFIEHDTPLDGDLVPVGFPVDGKEVLLLDEEGHEADEGEIVVRSRSLSPGYWKQPERTEGAFRPDPRGGPARLYHTGDLGRRLPDGRLVHLGRNDFQVKIRGHRVEIGAVENALMRLPSVREAAVVAKDDIEGRRQLVAYLVPVQGPAPPSTALRAALSETLPDYMIPSRFRVLEDFAKTSNDKLDRKPLLAGEPGVLALESGEQVAPRTDLEEKVARAWCQVLRRDEVGVTDDFFDLGGDSLDAMKLMARLESELGHRVPPVLIERARTVEELARQLAGQIDVRVVPLRGGDPEVSPLWLLHSFAGTLIDFRELLAAFEGETPVLGLTPAPRGTDLAADTIEAMAERQVETLLQHREGSRPIRLAGWSFGGTLAWEMARQLTARGEPVERLILIDTFSRLPRPGGLGALMRAAPAFLANVPRWLADELSRAGWSTPWRAITERRSSERFHGIRNLLPEERALVSTHVEAIHRYRPQPWEGPVLLLRARTRPLLHSFTDDAGWRLLASDLEIRTLPGNHLDLIRGRSARLLAREIEARL